MMKRLAASPLALALSLILTTSSVPAYAEISDKEFSVQMDKYLTSTEGRESVYKALQNYMRDAQSKQAEEEAKSRQAEMEKMFKNPVSIPIGKSPIKGPPDAKVTIVEFSDFECPYCKKGKETMDRVLQAYPADVKLVFKNIPLPMHPNARPAAIAALAAQKQGKFWQFHDALFANQHGLTPELYEKTAKDLGMDVEKFKADLKDPEIEAQVKEDEEIGRKNGIQGTPGFFVGGVAVRGAYPYEHFKMIIDRHLGKDKAEPAK